MKLVRTNLTPEHVEPNPYKAVRTQPTRASRVMMEETNFKGGIFI